MEEFKWELEKSPKKPIYDGDLGVANLPVKVIFQWSDKIVDEYDAETKTTKYKSGYIMKVLPDQSFVYQNQEYILIGNLLVVR